MASGKSNAPAFKKSTRLKSGGRPIHLVGEVPGEGLNKGDMVNILVTAKDASHQKKIHLTRKLAEGGEGAVFATSIKGYVAKIYFRNKITTDRADKLKIMMRNPIDCSGVCFPEALILNSKSEFVGYLMREASGYELGRSIFQPKLFLQKFPNWTRPDSIELCLNILEKIEHLNRQNVIIGDINPANILVVSPREVYFVDCDSYQIEGYPCPVGTANYTAPEAQGKDYKTFLRTQEMENFAIATLMFMIMLPGKPPYSSVGGASPEKNIANGEFPYPLTENTDKTPPGKWGYIWDHMSYKTKEAFFQTFKRGEKHFVPAARYNAHDWKGIFEAYRYGFDKMVSNDPMASWVFPTRKKGDNVVEHRVCKQCRKSFGITKNQVEWEQRKTEREGSPVRIEICDECKSSGHKPRCNSRSSQASSTASASLASKIQGYARAPQTKSSSPNSSGETPFADNLAIIVLGVVAGILLLFGLVSLCGNLASQASSSQTSAHTKTSSSKSSSTQSSMTTYQALRDKLYACSKADLAKAGYASFGSYPATHENLPMQIFWVLVDSTDAYDEYISVFVIEWLPYNETEEAVEWTQTSLYRWLNSDFYAAAFTESERRKMVPFEGGSYVGLLDLARMDLLKEAGVSRAAFPTPYATSKGAEDTWTVTDPDTGEVTEGLANWWLSYAGISSKAPTAYEPDIEDHVDLTQSCGVVPVIRIQK